MKKISSILLMGLLIFLSACSILPAGAATPAEPSPTPGVIGENYPSSMPVASQLALGTLRLKGTANDLTADEASALLFLWQGLNTVATASSPAKPEIDALVGQIQQTMKPTQVEAIAAMKLTNADIAKTAQEMGLAFGGGGFGGGGQQGGTGGTTGSGTTANRTTNGGNNGGGGGFGGGGGGFGGIPGAGNTGGGAAGSTTSRSSSAAVPASSQATVAARATQRALTGNTALYIMVINFLQSVATPAATATPAAIATPAK